MGGSSVRHRVRLEEPGSTARDSRDRGAGKRAAPRTGLPARSAALALLGAWGVFLAVGVLTGGLPAPLSLEDEAARPGVFVADRAWGHLVQLASLGPRPTGSYENEVLAVDLLAREVGFIRQQAHPSQRLSLDVQRASGAYRLATFVNSYSRVQNVVARLHSATNSSSSLLINCHFDSVPKSPGASDDALSCAVMLEVLRVLSRSGTPLPSDVIFLFNGAEEAPLKASHGFITQHEWAGSVRAFINLEACGTGGREILFQAGPQHSWLVKLYAESVPHPHGLVLAEDIFQSGLVPSDTDFRVFRDFGHVPGLDFAHAMNGYVYHTRHDGAEAVPRGALQHSGDNLLALARAVASAPALRGPGGQAAGRAVYFDVLGLFMVCYSERLSVALNLLAVALSACSAYLSVRFALPGRSDRERAVQLGLGCAAAAAGWGLGAVAAAAVALALDSLHASMSWFTHTSLVFGLYYLPALAGAALPPLALDWHRARFKAGVSTAAQALVCCCGAQLAWSLLLLACTALGVRSGFVPLLLVAVPSLAGLALAALPARKSVETWLAAYFASSLVPVPFTMYLTQLAFGLFIPITARIGPDRNPDLLIALLAALTCAVSCSYVVPMVLLVRGRAKVAAGLVALFLLTLVLAAFTPIGFPFREGRDRPTPQRVMLFHAERTVSGADGEVTHHGSGYWLFPLDRHNVRTLRGLVPELGGAATVSEDCARHLYCALPVYWARMVPMLSRSYWVPAAAPVFHSPVALQLTGRSAESVTSRRLAFTAKGVDNLAVFLSPAAGVRLTGWSFSAGQPEPGPDWLGRPSYFVHHASGSADSANSSLHFWLQLQVPLNSSGPVVDIGVAGHYLSSRSNIGPQFRKLCADFPAWAHVTAWTAAVKLFKY
ncbi:endoplasmic reticulum metallopeptidase 1-like isoform X4 [Bacillus rossius redtenbacheri]|uniref:endoplasmic reticulum metallopeptidase 1-like isoform X4 n=1 Tax=Bacillus rossius redtenbacheri TaxID=93214 RepID=UPI002FDE495D